MSDVLRAALIACMAELELAPEDEGRCGEYPELCTACKAYEQARAALASDTGSVGALDEERLAFRGIVELAWRHGYHAGREDAEWRTELEIDSLASAYGDAERQGES